MADLTAKPATPNSSKEGSSSERRASITKVDAQEVDEDLERDLEESFQDILDSLGEQKHLLRKQQRRDDAKLLAAAKKHLAAKQETGKPKGRDPFKRPCAHPQHLGAFQRMPVKYLEAKDAAMMDRPDRCRWYASATHAPFQHGDSVPRTFDDLRYVRIAKAKDPACKLDVVQFLSNPIPGTPKARAETAPTPAAATSRQAWNYGNSTPRELDSFRPLLERAGQAALAASMASAPKSAR
eukprot:TRINITY_DN51928_c0_g1_i1.p1 TRINITY_DN51928_c0_g1~~TRINITY_DN51928_c0_g1_i1.p1  ORF type:complete len:239 (+),score=43.67 TRINITY_DN51928_c0_g1_i1:59-775(+)